MTIRDPSDDEPATTDDASVKALLMIETLIASTLYDMREGRDVALASVKMTLADVKALAEKGLADG